MQSLKRSVSWFLVVGAMAAFVHYVIAVTLESLGAVRPAWSNIIGFCAAFPVSYIGHRYLSFSGQSKSHQQALPRFLAIAVFGFLANQTLVLLGLHFTALPFWLLLALVMVMVAIGTYWLSKHWAF